MKMFSMINDTSSHRQASLVWRIDNVLPQIKLFLKSEHRPQTVISSTSAEKACGLHGFKIPWLMKKWFFFLSC